MTEVMPFTQDERFDLDLLRSAVRYQQWVLSAFGDAVHGRVLEVGSGIGNMTRWLALHADRVVAVEPDEVMSNEINELGLPNVEVMALPLEGIGEPPESFDSAVLVNVLEHFEDDVGALEAVRALLRPGGHVCILAPAHSQLYGSLDRRYGHVRRYKRTAVAAKMRSAGFDVSFARYFNPIGAVGWFLVGKLGRRRRLSLPSITLTERVAVPAGRALERLGDPPFGQSVVAVGVRPGG
jgi:SAM-dependent methyltransferase